MIPNAEELSNISDEAVRILSAKLPDAELYELGAMFLSIGCYLTANAIPDLWPQLKNTALLSQQLLNQEEAKQKSNIILP